MTTKRGHLLCVCLNCTCDGHTVSVGAAALELSVQDSLSSDAVLSSLLQGGDMQWRLLSWPQVDISLIRSEEGQTFNNVATSFYNKTRKISKYI